MASSKEFKSEVKELIAPIKENKNSNWCKYIARIAYNSKPANIDIRNIKFEEDGSTFLGKGISLTDEECDSVVDILVERGYGSTSKLKNSLNKRESVFGKNASKLFDDDDCDEDFTDGILKIKLGRARD